MAKRKGRASRLSNEKNNVLGDKHVEKNKSVPPKLQKGVSKKNENIQAAEGSSIIQDDIANNLCSETAAMLQIAESPTQQSEENIQELDYGEQMIKNKEGFLQAYRAHKSTTSGFKFDDLISTKTGEVLEKMWQALNDIATECAIDMFPSNQDSNELKETEGSELAINGILLLGRLTIEDQKDTELKLFTPPKGLKDTAILLHGVLPSIPSEKDTVKNNISKLCELWYTKQLPDGDTLATNALPYILQRAMKKESAITNGGGPVKADIKRVHIMQSAILDNNISASSSRLLRDLLLEAVRTPMFYKTPEGSRFLAFLFTISPTFIPQLHASIKYIIPGSTPPFANSIGEVYFKAWRSCEGSFKTNIEELCIQDLMQRGILANPHLPKNIKIFSPIRHILKVIHRAKNDRQAQAMLSKLYQPILWRNLKVANSQVRANAAQLFFDAFPIEDPNVHAEERAIQQERQVQIMCNLLKDESADVRIISIAGASQLIAKYWLILSSTDLNKLVKIFVVDLAVDASSPQVRVEVLKGFKHILTTCVRSHMYLKKILPKIRDSLHDIKDSVRQGTVDLLSAVSSVKMIKYWDICPVEHILARLEVEKSTTICTKIVDLLFNSYFPIQEDEDTKIKRCICLIQQNQIACRKFYSLSPKFIPMHNQVKFMLAILVSLKRNIKLKLGQQTKYSVATNTSSQDKHTEKEPTFSQTLESENTSEAESEADKENNEGSIDGSFAGKKRRRKRLYTQPNKSIIINTSPSVIPHQEYIQTDITSQDSSMDRSLSIDSSANISLGINDTTQGDQNTVNQGEDEGYITELEDDKIVGALLDVVCILWMARSTDIVQEENAEYRSLLEKKASKLVSVLFKFYRSSDVIRPLIYLCSFLPHSSVTTMAGFCLSQLRNSKTISSDESDSQSTTSKLQLEKAFDLAWTGNQTQIFNQSNPLPTYIDALCNWNRGDDILELVTNWISRDLRERQVNNRNSVGMGRSKNNVGRKGVRFSESAGLGAAKPQLALQLIKYIFRHPVNREILLRKNRPQVEELKDTLRKYVDEFVHYLPNARKSSASQEDLSANQNILCEVWQSLLTLTMLLHFPNKAAWENPVNNAILEGIGSEHKKRSKSTTCTTNTTGQTETDVFIVLEDLLEWTETNLLDLPHLSKDIFSLRLLNGLINTCSNTVTLGIADTSFIGLSLEFADKVLSNIERSQEETPNELTNLADEKHDISSDFEDIISACLKPICRYVRH